MFGKSPFAFLKPSQKLVLPQLRKFDFCRISLLSTAIEICVKKRRRQFHVRKVGEELESVDRAGRSIR